MSNLNSSNYFQLVERLQNSIDALDAILMGDENATVNIQGVVRDSIAKEIKDSLASIQAMVQGRLAFQTRAELLASGAPSSSELAEVWNDPLTENNGLYGWDGSAWVRSELDTAVNLYDEIEKQENYNFYNFSKKIKTPLATLGQALNGASFYDGVNTAGATNSDGGWFIPAGVTGHTTFLYYRWMFSQEESALLSGKKLRFLVDLENSPNILTAFTNPFSTSGTVFGTEGQFSNSEFIEISENRTAFIFDYEFTGDETEVRHFIQVQNPASAITEDAYMLARGQYYAEINSPAFAEDQAKKTAFLAASGLSSVPDNRYGKRYYVGDGEDFSSPYQALENLTGEGISNRVKLILKEEIFEDPEYFDKDFVDFVGVNKYSSIIKFHQPNDTTGADIASDSAIFVRRETRLENLTISAKNARYAIHLESDGNYKNRLQEIINCNIEHLGNDDAPSNFWGAQYAIGSGVSSGQVVRIKDCDVKSKRRGGFSYHTNVDFDSPSHVELIRSRFIARTEGTYSFDIKPLGSFQSDTCVAKGCVFGGDIAIIVSPWLQTELDKQPADHNEVTLTGFGNSPAVFHNEDWGESLRIDSATDGAASSIEVSGDAVAYIFGDGSRERLFTRKGSAGFSGAVWGWGDISSQAVGPGKNVLNKMLGQRLGDCTSINKTLSVLINGSSIINIVFSDNYTNQTNQDVIGFINNELGSAAFASIYMPGSLKRPMFSDEEIAPKNTSGSGIKMGSIVAFDNAFDKVRLMTAADPKTIFAGVAWEDIESNDRGRVKSSGYLPITDILRSDADPISFGDTFSIDPATPGVAINGGSQGIMMAIRSDAVKVS